MASLGHNELTILTIGTCGSNYRSIILKLVIQNTVRCRYNAVNFITSINKIHPMARPLERGMGCLLWIQHLIDIISQFMQNLTILDRVITAHDCSSLDTHR